jgi:hypothetical protein
MLLCRCIFMLMQPLSALNKTATKQPRLSNANVTEGGQILVQELCLENITPAGPVSLHPFLSYSQLEIALNLGYDRIIFIR